MTPTSPKMAMSDTFRSRCRSREQAGQTSQCVFRESGPAPHCDPVKRPGFFVGGEMSKNRKPGRLYYEWEFMVCPVEWVAAAKDREKSMHHAGFARCSICAKIWLHSHEAKRQAKLRRRLLGGRPGEKPWIYPKDCFHKDISKLCSEHRKPIPRNVLIARSTPKWADPDKIAEIYVKAGCEGKHVDHIIPLQGASVCGLHVEYNLQIISSSLNLWKSNRLFEAYQNG